MKDPFCMIVIGIFFVTTNGKSFLKSQTIKVLNNYFTVTEVCNNSFLMCLILLDFFISPFLIYKYMYPMSQCDCIV